MQQVEVQIVEPEPAQTRIEGPQCGVVAVVGDPQFGGDEHLGSVDAGPTDAVADLPLVVVRGGCVDEHVAVVDGPVFHVTPPMRPPAGSGHPCNASTPLASPRPRSLAG
jgi:hypothetical protein